MRLVLTSAEVPHTGPLRSVLLLGNYRPTLTIARVLAADGCNVVLGLDRDGGGSAQFSKAVHEVWDHPPLHGRDGLCFGEELDGLLARRPDIAIIYPVAEEFVRWCAENDGMLADRVVVASPAPAVVLRCLDKAAMVEAAHEARIPCLPLTIAKSMSELHAAADALGYPVVVRPSSHLLRLGHKKAVIAADRRELDAAFPAWPVNQERLLVQRFARGRRHDVYFAARRGKALRLLEAMIVRTDSPDGTGLSVEGKLVPVSPDLAEFVRRLLEKLDYTGVGCAQFLVDPVEGGICFLELNPRIAGSHRCTEWAGMDLTRLAMRLAAGAIGTEQPFSYQPGAVYAWTYGDLGGLKAARGKREIGAGQALAWVARCASTWLRADFHLTYDRGDPMPTLRGFLLAVPAMRRRAKKNRLAASRRSDSRQSYSAASASGSTDT